MGLTCRRLGRSEVVDRHRLGRYEPTDSLSGRGLAHGDGKVVAVLGDARDGRVLDGSHGILAAQDMSRTAQHTTRP